MINNFQFNQLDQQKIQSYEDKITQLQQMLFKNDEAIFTLDREVAQLKIQKQNQES